jgi:hypothetical protein
MKKPTRQMLQETLNGLSSSLNYMADSPDDEYLGDVCESELYVGEIRAAYRLLFLFQALDEDGLVEKYLRDNPGYFGHGYKPEHWTGELATVNGQTAEELRP